MKSVRQILLGAFLTVSAFTAVLYTSCSKDACKDVTCNNGGTCSGGNCTCASNYEGVRCDSTSRQKFIKTWAATDVNTSTSVALAPYSSVISAGATITDVLIGNFSSAYFTNAVKATVTGSTITIPSQQPDNDGYAVEGTGTYSGGKIAWTYKITQVSTNLTVSYSGNWN